MSAGHTDVTEEQELVCDTPPDECGVRDLVDRIGGKWSAYVLVELAAGMRRFKELQRAIPGGVSQRMLTLTVRHLERDGLLTRTVRPTVPPQVEYELTEMGRDCTTLIRALADWEVAHRPAITAHRAAFDAANPGFTGR
ncbi:HxlR family transcriptional regulator [Mangrovactinospora gilvigrisea]|uniref:HxlR family transcriptional regulator n=1 Tax=Mangrovactinospora gilvigrisea TaxID=1428644 RepID=A0A1J7BEL4_9ACTN|nr:helix-turn-helix domain-containing protein [Mangrovactinospora gilvigrisea]OIV37123.1 HxlR family transcriptional regulator [Mangrovactinospora gilvigrisea]